MITVIGPPNYKDIQNVILDFIDDDQQDPNNSFFYNDLESKISYICKFYLETILRFLSIISNYHHRSRLFFTKIENIIKHFRISIVQLFSSSEITQIFIKNKRMILFLYNERMIASEDFVLESLKTNTTIFALSDIEKYFQSLFRKRCIFDELIYNFNTLYKDELLELMEEYKLLNLFIGKFSEECSYSSYYGYYSLSVFGDIDFRDVFPKFIDFVDKEINKNIETIVKYLFFIQKQSNYSRFRRIVWFSNDRKDIIYNLFYSKLRAYHDNKEFTLKKQFNSDYYIERIRANERKNYKYERKHNKKPKKDNKNSFYVKFCADLIDGLINRMFYLNLDIFICSQFYYFFEDKNEHEKNILMLHINSFISKLMKKHNGRPLSLIQICQLSALFVDEIIEKILEFEFSDFLQKMIELLKAKYDSCLEDLNMKEKFLAGENDSYICELIRNDSVEEFIKYVNQANIPLSSNIQSSICETNTFLLKKETSFIDYAAYFGSIQIFQYLRINGVELRPSLWLNAIHGRNPEIIYILEENKVEMHDNLLKKCLIRSIKCHHNEIADYIDSKYYDDKIKKENSDEKVNNASVKYCNFEYIPSDLPIYGSFQQKMIIITYKNFDY